MYKNNILFLKPRLDCTFKAGPCPMERDMSVPLPPIRTHWDNFTNKIAEFHRNDNFQIIEAPLWTFTPELVNDLAPQVAYIPHKQAYQFPLAHGIVPQYYAQTVFPWLFTVDVDGWGADSSIYKNWFPWATGDQESGIFEELRDRAYRNESKFAQPSEEFEERGYVLFVCQLPHDEVIKYHSQVSVAQALEFTLQFCRQTKRKCVVKGHPVNPGSMIELRQLAKKYEDCCVWVDAYSIHSLIENSESVFLVNSGVGYEAILHSKPVYCFGRAEYDCVVRKVDCFNMEKLESTYTTTVHLNRYRSFIDKYVINCVDSTPLK